MGSAIVFLLAGLTICTTLLEAANERILSRLGLVGFTLTSILWVIFSAFRATVPVTAAQELEQTGEVPTYYEPVGQWAFALFKSYAVVGYLSLSAYSGSFLQTGLIPAWAAWITIVFSIALLVIFLVQGDTLPVFHYLPPLLIGILLVALG